MTDPTPASAQADPFGETTGKVERLNEHDVAVRAALDEEKAAAENDLGDADPSVLDIALVRRYRELREAQGISEAEAKAMKEEANKIEEQLVEMFGEAGLQNLQVDGKTIYLHRSTYAQRKPGVETDDVKAALRAAGAPELITETVNANTLAAWLREFDDREEAFPEPIEEVLELGERFSVRINAAGSRAKSKTRSK